MSPLKYYILCASSYFLIYLVDDSVFINWWRGQGAWLCYDHWPRGDGQGSRTKVSDLYRFACEIV